MMLLSPSAYARARRARLCWSIAAAFSLLLLAVAAFRNGWVSDDAFITYRSVHHLTVGEGLVYNAGERVQTFTHPLWALLLVPVYALAGDLHRWMIAFGVIVSLTAVAVSLRGIASERLRFLLPLALASSTSFVDYCTSGLENPLTYLLLAALGLVGSPATSLSPDRRLSVGAFVVGLLLCTRHDLLLMGAPVLALLIARARMSWPRRIGAVLVGLSPILLWTAFSLLYYGFPFPNSAYAKLGVDFDRSVLLARGLLYLRVSLSADPVGAAAVALLFAAAALRRDPTIRCWAAGVALYLAYTAWIGGDFMRGRFVAAPIFAAMSALAMGRPFAPCLRRFRHRAGIVVALAATSLLLPFLSGAPPIVFSERSAIPVQDASRFVEDSPGQIIDEKRFFFHATGWNGAVATTEPSLLAIQSDAAPRHVYAGVMAGYPSLIGGASRHFVDFLGVADPLLARLPPRGNTFDRVGHYPRTVPAGYLASLVFRENRIARADVAALHSDLQLASTGPLFRRGRLEAIWRLNTGAHRPLARDPLLIEPAEELLRENASFLTELVHVDAAALDGSALEVPTLGAQVWFRERQHSRTIVFEARMHARFYTTLLRSNAFVGKPAWHQAGTPGSEAAVEYRIDVPEDEAAAGFDRIMLVLDNPINENRFNYLVRVRTAD